MCERAGEQARARGGGLFLCARVCTRGCFDLARVRWAMGVLPVGLELVLVTRLAEEVGGVFCLVVGGEGRTVVAGVDRGGVVSESVSSFLKNSVILH